MQYQSGISLKNTAKFANPKPPFGTTVGNYFLHSASYVANFMFKSSNFCYNSIILL